MRNARLFVAFALLGLAFVGCSGSKQHKDPSWTTKPSNLQVVFTAPVVLDSAKDNCPMFPWYYSSVSVAPATICEKDVLMLPEEMKKMSDWFLNGVDNTLKFNSSSHYKISEVSKDLVSYSEKEVDGETVRVPMLKSMSDSADVYMVLDNIQLKSNVSVREGASMNLMSVGMTVGSTINSNCVHISASYAFYEMKTTKTLDYGYLEESQCSDQMVIEHDWQNVLRDLILHAIDKTPIAQF
jgi:hypothetical protein